MSRFLYSFWSILFIKAICIEFCFSISEDGFKDYGCNDDYKDTTYYGEDGLPTFRPLIVAHRGASGMYPEHTQLAYKKAAIQGADMIECDLALTKDLVFVCLHEPWISKTTNVASNASYANRKKKYLMNDDDPKVNWNDKGEITDWFTFDFTLAELKGLKKIQSSDSRDPRYDYQETIVTLSDLVSTVRNYSSVQKRTIGIYVELKHPFAMNTILKERNINSTFESLALKALDDLGYNKSSSACYLQSFEPSVLEAIKNETDLKMIFLAGRNLTEPEWKRIKDIGIFGVGVNKNVFITKGEKDDIGRGSYQTNVTHFIEKAHSNGWKVHAYTFNNEWMNLYWQHGLDPYSELKEFLDIGLDGYFTDHPLTLRRFLHYENRLCVNSSTSRSIPVTWQLLESFLIVNVFNMFINKITL